MYRIYIGGSFVSRKTYPKDFDICWDDEKVDFELLSNLDINLLDIVLDSLKERIPMEIFNSFLQ